MERKQRVVNVIANMRRRGVKISTIAKTLRMDEIDVRAVIDEMEAKKK